MKSWKINRPIGFGLGQGGSGLGETGFHDGSGHGYGSGHGSRQGHGWGDGYSFGEDIGSGAGCNGYCDYSSLELDEPMGRGDGETGPGIDAADIDECGGHGFGVSTPLSTKRRRRT